MVRGSGFRWANRPARVLAFRWRAAMLYELFTAEVRPGTLGTAVQRLGETVATRGTSSGLLGCWTTEIGQVNELVALSAAAGSPSVGDGVAGHWLASALT